MPIRVLTSRDSDAFSRLRLKALTEEPDSFSSSPADHVALSQEDLEHRLTPTHDSVVLGLFDSVGQLVGTAGVFRESPAKHAHKAFMWGVYVHPGLRGQGQGKALVRAAIEQAARMPQVELLQTSVFLTAPHARQLYLGCGFISWGQERLSAKVAGRYIDEEHLSLVLRGTAREA